jgi:hypothetical protein
MMRKTPNSTTRRPKTARNPARGGYPADWLADANAGLSSEAQFHDFLEESPDGVIIVDPTGELQWGNYSDSALNSHLGITVKLQ